MSDRDDVLDQLLDQAGGCPRPGHAGGDLPPDPLHPARQQPEGAAASLLHQGHRHVHERVHRVRVLQPHRVRPDQRHHGGRQRNREEEEEKGKGEHTEQHNKKG